MIRPLSGFLALAWLLGILAIHLYTEHTGRPDFFDLPFPETGGRPGFSLLLHLFTFAMNLFGVAGGFAVGLFWAFERLRSKVLWGAIAGAAFGLWVASLHYTLPYLGTYPNLPAFLVVDLAARGLGRGFPSHSLGWMALASVLLWALTGTAWLGLLTLAMRRREDPTSSAGGRGGSR
jgi:hypothetical protein